jgi:hypothetical protein
MDSFPEPEAYRRRVQGKRTYADLFLAQRRIQGAGKPGRLAYERG